MIISVPITLGNNIASLMTQRSILKNSEELTSVYQRLSSGMKINNASDDAAGLAISSTLRQENRVLVQAVRNVSDGISALNITQGALQELHSIGLRQYELAEQSANGTYSNQQRTMMGSEANALVSEWNRITATTKFNGINLLDGTLNSSYGGISLQVGADSQVQSQLAFGIGDQFNRSIGTLGAESTTAYSAFATNQHVAVADINNDGKLDIVRADSNSSSSAITYMQGNGDGTFLAARSFNTGMTNILSLYLTDINLDGKKDIFFNYGGPSGVLLGNGNGTFFAPITIFNTTGTVGTVSDFGDINGDGKIDMIGGDNGSAPYVVDISIGNGDGTFNISTSITPSNSNAAIRGIALADLNGDGKLDVVSNSFASPGAQSVFLGNGDGTFNAPRSYIAAGNPNDMIIFDANGDGIPDIATASQSQSAGIMIGNGDGSFKANITYIVAGGSSTVNRSIKSADVNGDGYNDLILLSSSTSAITLLLNNGNGTFQSARSIATLNPGNGKYGLDLGDFNGDGVVDFVTNDTTASQILVIIQSSRKVGSIAALNLSTQSYARSAIDTIKNALDRVSAELGSIGAIQSRQAIIVSNLRNRSENIEAAASRILDSDIAFDSAELAKKSILQKTGIAVLAQANQIPAIALQLLKS